VIFHFGRCNPETESSEFQEPFPTPCRHIDQSHAAPVQMRARRDRVSSGSKTCSITEYRSRHPAIRSSSGANEASNRPSSAVIFESFLRPPLSPDPPMPVTAPGAAACARSGRYSRSRYRRPAIDGNRARPPWSETTRKPKRSTKVGVSPSPNSWVRVIASPLLMFNCRWRSGPNFVPNRQRGSPGAPTRRRRRRFSANRDKTHGRETFLRVRSSAPGYQEHR
jgi:hypothetical protein